jgi:hypothetical protein
MTYFEKTLAAGIFPNMPFDMLRFSPSGLRASHVVAYAVTTDGNSWENNSPQSQGDTMSTSNLVQNAPPASVALVRLLWAAPVAIALATAANVVLYTLANAVFGVAWEPLFTLFGVIGSTVAYLLVAAIVYAAVLRLSGRPIWLYRRIAIVALLLSFFPPVSALLGMAGQPGSGVTAAPLDTFLTMLVMHTVTYAISVPVFTRLTAPGTPPSAKRDYPNMTWPDQGARLTAVRQPSAKQGQGAAGRRQGHKVSNKGWKWINWV